MTQIVLLRDDQNPYRRRLVQEGTTMYVLTGCCEARFGSFIDESGTVWTQCSNCDTLLDRNPDGWSSDVENLNIWAEYVPSGVSRWAWFWFGLEDFKVTVTL